MYYRPRSRANFWDETHIASTDSLPLYCPESLGVNTLLKGHKRCAKVMLGICNGVLDVSSGSDERIVQV